MHQTGQTSEARLRTTEILLDVLLGIATNSSSQDFHLRYEALRNSVLADKPLAALMPDLVRKCRNTSEFWDFIKNEYGTYAERRQFLRGQFDRARTVLEDQILGKVPGDNLATATLLRLDAAHVHEVWQKALERRDSDPDGAITAARTLLEAVCKGILDQLGLPYDDKLELPKLYSLTAQQMNLAPYQHSEEIFRQILGGCQSVVVGLGAMRSKHSDAHGRGRAGARPTARHAHLAVNLAGAMATFLVETLEFRTQYK